MGGDNMTHMNTSSAGVEPALYYPGQKRPGEDGGEDVLFCLLIEMFDEHICQTGVFDQYQNLH